MGVKTVIRDILYILFGYLSGSVLFAQVFGKLVAGKDITADAGDKNPGTANAFMQGGVLCGILTLFAELGKGFLPVFLYCRGQQTSALMLVMAAPVLGHIFPVFFHFRGGKGIAVTFGCLLALLPGCPAAYFLAAFFLFFSLVVRISPHYYRTLLTYLCTEAAAMFFCHNLYIRIGFSLIFVAVFIKMLSSREEKKPLKVGILWMY